jgi:hypothetical protein
MNIQYLNEKIFKINSSESFNETALEIFRYQVQTNQVYKTFVERLNLRAEKIKTIETDSIFTHRIFQKSHCDFG